jgi:hypothetical protein
MSGIIIKIYPLNKKISNNDHVYIFDNFVYEYNVFIESDVWITKEDIQMKLVKLNMLNITNGKNDDIICAIDVYKYLLKKIEETNKCYGMIQYL